MTSLLSVGGVKAPALQTNRTALLAALIVAASMATGCGEVARTGKAPAFLIIDRIQGSSGPDGEFTTVLQSDVEQLVETDFNGQTIRVPTVFNDIGEATFRLALKNPGTSAAPLTPTTINEITIQRYRVSYRRSDGRNTQGVDVPYSFDGAVTVTVPANGSVTTAFDLVRHQAKREAPLSTMKGGGSAHLLSTIAEVTFYGRDQAGNEVTAAGTIGVNFADFGDPR